MDFASGNQNLLNSLSIKALISNKPHKHSDKAVTFSQNFPKAVSSMVFASASHFPNSTLHSTLSSPKSWKTKTMELPTAFLKSSSTPVQVPVNAQRQTKSENACNSFIHKRYSQALVETPLDVFAKFPTHSGHASTPKPFEITSTNAEKRTSLTLTPETNPETIGSSVKLK